MQHSPGFLKLVNEARLHVKEIGIDEVVLYDAGPP